jgi:hypothetical protein
VLLVCLALRPALADDAQAILVVRVAGDERIVSRARAELVALGYNVVVMSAAGGVPEPLKSLASARQAHAALRSTPSNTGIELWVGDPSTGRTAFEEVVALETTERNDQLLALRATEVVRARLIESLISPRPREQSIERDVPPEPAPVLDSHNRHVLLSLEAGAGYLEHQQRLDGGFHGTFALRTSPHRSFALSAFLVLPLEKARLAGESGDATVDARIVGIGLEYVPVQQPFRAAFGGGAGLASIGFEGEAEPPLEARTGSIATAILSAHVAATVDVGWRVRLRPALMVAWSVPRVVVRIAGQEEAAWGQPLFLGTIGLEFGVLDSDL